MTRLEEVCYGYKLKYSLQGVKAKMNRKNIKAVKDIAKKTKILWMEYFEITEEELNIEHQDSE